MKIQICIESNDGKKTIFDPEEMNVERMNVLVGNMTDDKLCHVAGEINGNYTIIRGSFVKDSIITFKNVE